ncbi:peptidoglycan D,D-transpeptidase FtsI family protein [Priestia endophytica]|uniref:peptidoglycan D,D-transpeptidase FtsI family protein n=1 Tax=Priestia endophytica TaxID=135735 RepID=UPI00227FEB76|nr:penicillin-binding protein 2 [Priestia endophytica]MCY8233582.1 penicillin-binding protein 2 [Priestia endophytica]
MKPYKRMKKLAFILLCFMLILVARLAQIQLIQTESFSRHHINLIEASVRQRTQEMVIDDGRGKFVDQNGEPLTHHSSLSLVMFPFLKELKWPSDKVASFVGMSEYALKDKLNKASEPVVIEKEITETEMKSINSLKIPGLFAVPLQKDDGGHFAEHLIGLTGQNRDLLVERYDERLKEGELSTQTSVGITGLQSAFDEFLIQEEESKLLYHVDRQGNPLFGLNVKYTGAPNPFYPVKVKTTLNKEKQSAVERIVDSSGLKQGGAVLVNIENNTVEALVSRPEINEVKPYGDGGVYNRMLIPYTPGSVFKTVIAAAALEQLPNVENRTFNCSTNIYGKKAQKDQGTLSFHDSFAESCNATFGQLGKDITAKDEHMIETYAKKLGLTTKAGWSGEVFHLQNFAQLPEEKKGMVWTDNTTKSPNAISQTSIGQLNVKASPLELANMMATIGRGGKAYEVRAVDKIQYKNGNTLFSFPKQELEGGGIKKETAEKLQTLLTGVVEEEKGTGRRFASLPYEVAGKSGTAQISDKKALVNKWFAGYFPRENPKYALVVVDLSVKDEEAKTNGVFYDIVNNVYELDQQSERK